MRQIKPPSAAWVARVGSEKTGSGLRATCSFWTTIGATSLAMTPWLALLRGLRQALTPRHCLTSEGLIWRQLQWRNWLAHGTYTAVRGRCRGCEFEPRLEQLLWFFPLRMEYFRRSLLFFFGGSSDAIGWCIANCDTTVRERWRVVSFVLLHCSQADNLTNHSQDIHITNYLLFKIRIK